MYCVRCKVKFQPRSGQQFVASNGAVMMRSQCPHCGSSCCQIVGRSGGASRGRSRSRKRASFVEDY
jgi:hypothetical protein